MRPLAIELAFDSASDERLARLWGHLSKLYGGPTDSELGVRPHITLALFRDGEPRNLSSAVASLAAALEPFDLHFAEADRFPGSEGVVFLRPNASAELMRAHSALHQLLAGERDLVHAYYRPETWHPHCTMAVNVPETLVDAVFSACGSTEALGEVRVASIRTVRYRPVTEIQRVWLGKTGV
jgi:2'-5' RNA ligase